MKYQVNQNDIRLDNYLSDLLEISRSQVTKMIKANEVLVNNKKVKPGFILKENDIIEVNHIEEEILKPEKMDLDIIYEDDDVLVVNKPNGMVVHPGAGNKNHTLVNGLLYHTKLSDNEDRPGIVHRIDAYTTGLLMVAKNNKAHEILSDELSKKQTFRKYVALVWGKLESDSGEIDAPIGRSKNDRKKMCVRADGKQAITHFKVLKRYDKVTLIELKLETGRTHQIRVHMDYINHPVVNDPAYGNRKLIDNSGQCLHAKMLGFHQPTTKEYLEFDSPLPECFINILKKFE